MKYYSISISTKEGEATNRVIYEHASVDAAIGYFHRRMAELMGATGMQEALVMVISGGGVVLRSERWALPEPEPTTEPEVNA